MRSNREYLEKISRDLNKRAEKGYLIPLDIKECLGIVRPPTPKDLERAWLLENYPVKNYSTSYVEPNLSSSHLS